MRFFPHALASRFPVLLISISAIPVLAEVVTKEEAGKVEFFEKKIRPLLASNCYTCHSATTKAAGGLRLDDRNGLLSGGNAGAAIVPGKPDESLLVEAIAHTDENLKMPPKKKLNDEQISDLKIWIEAGAAWPSELVSSNQSSTNPKYEKLKKEHWAWQPQTNPQPPSKKNSGWVRDNIDRFILSKLETRQLQPAADASKAALVRRVTFDLHGLPPSPAEVDAFLNDTSANAYEKLVDRLLASPAFGERWGRHWLDVARYGESTGASRNLPMPHAWRYRDYVIDSFNHDKPYNEFIREQVAGDLLTARSDQDKRENLIATGFLALGVKDVNQRFKVRFIMDNVDEQIDTVSRAVIGTTVSCARCHDHKFDPIPTRDYYALAGIFRSTDLRAGLRNKMGGGGLDYYDTERLIPLQSAKSGGPSAEQLEKAKKEVAEAKSAFEKLRDRAEGSELSPDGRPRRAVARQKFNQKQIALANLTDPSANGGHVALGVLDMPAVADTEVRIRGEAEKLGPVVPRGFLTAFDVPGAKPVNLKQSGRLELAEWLVNENNPLTTRVIANRVWQHLFGQGLVRSVDNFGLTGDRPEHPELLDHLAQRFKAEGWSIKKLVRAVALTHAYQIGSEATAENLVADPENRLVWRHSPRRLDAEEIRDTILAASGQLNTKRPVGSPAGDFKVIEIPNNGPQARQLQKASKDSQSRSVYLPLVRGIVPATLEPFDFVEQGTVSGSRSTTTVPTQALYLLNDPFVRRNALTLADQLVGNSLQDDQARLNQVYRLILGREPARFERDRATAFLNEFQVIWQEESAKLVQLASAKSGRVLQVSQRTTQSDPNSAPPQDKPKPAPKANDVAKTPAPPVNPDEVIQEDSPIVEEIIQPSNAISAAWAGLVQALFGSAEFRYLK